MKNQMKWLLWWACTKLSNWCAGKNAEIFPNSDLGIYVAEDIMLRGLQMRLDDSLCLKECTHNFKTISKYSEDARGGGGFFEVEVLGVVAHSVFYPWVTERIHFVHAHLHISCATNEHFWEPNHCGNYISVDGNDFFEITRDSRTGNIEIRECSAGLDEFKEKFQVSPIRPSLILAVASMAN